MQHQLASWKESSGEHWTFSKKVHTGKFRNFWNEITEKSFFLFPTVCIFDFCKNTNPRLNILFLVDKSMTEIMNTVLRIIRSLLLNVWSFFMFSLNFDPVKEILKIRCHIYIFVKKVIILRKIHAKNEVFRSTILHHRKKLNVSLSYRFITYSIRIGNLDWCKCQMQPLSENFYREHLCHRKHLQVLRNF